MTSRKVTANLCKKMQFCPLFFLSRGPCKCTMRRHCKDRYYHISPVLFCTVNKPINEAGSPPEKIARLAAISRHHIQ